MGEDNSELKVEAGARLEGLEVGRHVDSEELGGSRGTTCMTMRFAGL